ncbi:MAG: LPS-assembly protein LptD [Dichotomicrobium sp.]
MTHVLCVLWLAAASAVGGLLSAHTPAAAQQNLIEQSFGNVEGQQPMLLQADNLISDRKNNKVIAQGDVEVYYNNYSLVADELIYDQEAGTLEAVGNVRIKEPDGAVVKADRINLTEDFRDGFVRSLRIVTKQEERIAARRAYREGGETTVFEQGAYTPCKVCKDKEDDGPLWQIKARKIIHDKSEGNIYYEDATLEFLGLPIAYIPYFYHPDPTVTRRSGFLAPTFRQSDELGFAYEQPYYFAIAPNKDLTLAPVVTTDAGTLVKGDWRHRLEDGQYRVLVAGAYNDDPSDNAPTDSSFRGTIETQGNFRLGSFWNWGWDITAETDDTFRRFYKIDDLTETERTSEVYLIGQSDRNYFSAYAYSFQNLTMQDDPLGEDLMDRDTVVHPVIDYNYVSGEPVLGGELKWDTNVVSMTRDNGPESHHVVTELGWRRTLTGPIGQRVTPFAQARTDLYEFSSYETFDDEGDNKVTREGDTYTRQVLTGGADYRFPLVKHSSWGSQVVEPIAQVIFRSDYENGTEPPNEDAQSLVFDDTLLFDIDKFSGYDRLETGTRANYGLQYTLQSNYGFSLRAVAGQSYHIAGDNPYDDGTGLENDFSDYVAGMYFDVPGVFRLVSQARFDEESFDIRRLDLGASTNYGPVTSQVNYVNADPQPGIGVFDDREELLASAALQLTDLWSVYGDVRYNFEIDEPIEQSIGVKYACECFMMSVQYTKSEIRDRDIEPEETILVGFEFKNLGGADVKTDVTEGFTASDGGK